MRGVTEGEMLMHVIVVKSLWNDNDPIERVAFTSLGNTRPILVSIFFINVYTRIYIQTRAFLHVCMPLAFTLYSISPVDNTFLLTESDIRCDRMVKRWSCLHEDFCFSCCFWEYILAHLEHKSANIFSFLLIRTERRRVSPCSLIVKARSEIFFSCLASTRYVRSS